MNVARAFASDNTAPAHPAVLDAIVAANTGPAHAYGGDAWTARAEAWFREMFGEGTSAFMAWNGTGANVIALQAALRPWQAVICVRQAHINVDECGAPERFAGCKLIDVPTKDAKLTTAQLDAAITGVGIEHSVQPRLLSLTQTTEYGTAYTRDELTSLCDLAHSRDMLVHVDGARIANAAATLNLPLRAFTRDAGVDLLSFGATKNGGIGAEAVVVFDVELARDLRFIRKQSAQLASKMRFLAAQFIGLAEGDRWLANATHANAMARRLADGVRGHPGVRITQPVESNAVFAQLDLAVTTRLQERFHFHVWDDATGEVRWMTNWATTPADVDEFIEAIADALPP